MAGYSYTAGWNMPGYLPESDPETFTAETQAEAAHDALDYLADTLDRWADDSEEPEPNGYDITRDRIREEMETMADTTMTGWLFYTPDRRLALWAEVTDGSD
jgi:hypothetical protein